MAPRVPQWNQWRRPGAPPFADRTVSAKRDFTELEKVKVPEQSKSGQGARGPPSLGVPSEGPDKFAGEGTVRQSMQVDDAAESGKQTIKRQSSLVSTHSAVRAFFGQPMAEDHDEDTGTSDAVREPLSTSEEEESDVGDDLTLFNAKFERQKRQLEAQMVDLGSRTYRATTPLEAIARLCRVSMGDLLRVHEQRQNEMEVDDPSPAQTQRPHIHPRANQSPNAAEGHEQLTPKGERIARGADVAPVGVDRPFCPRSPGPVSLPYMLHRPGSPFHEVEHFPNRMKVSKVNEDELLDALEDVIAAQQKAENDVQAVFTKDYRRWREECEDLDRLKEDRQQPKRQLSAAPRAEVEASPVPYISGTLLEGRRHKFSSEYEIAQVLKQSEETARIEQERLERETKKNQADMEREAKAPDQVAGHEYRKVTFVDTNQLCDPKSLTRVFTYEPPPDTFTNQEQQIFIMAFKETPKKWSEIASLLPGRTYKDCIQHYYANKWDRRFRDGGAKKGKGGGGGRRVRGIRAPRGRVGIMADLRTGDDLPTDVGLEKGRPRRAAAPTTFGEKEADAKTHLPGASAKRPAPGTKTETGTEAAIVPEKPGPKKQKRAGEKTGRKAKGAQPLVQLAAAPQASPGKPVVHPALTKEELARAQKLEEASLLAHLHGGAPRPNSNLDGTSDPADKPVPLSSTGGEDAERPTKVGGPPPPTAKQSASSYWSVPEQTDFMRYIEHFGRDYAAIAAHMGTKTTTMIKNYYQRQMDGGNHVLEQSASNADERRSRGEALGPPPTPTPINKRKYDNPPAMAQRPLAPQTEPTDADDHIPGPTRPATAKHTSPPQLPTQPRYPATSAQNTPMPATGVAPSPSAATTTVASSAQLSPATSNQPSRHPPESISRVGFVPDARAEPSQTKSQQGAFRLAQEPTTRASQVVTPNAADPSFIQSLRQEQQRAFRMQEQYTRQDRIEKIHQQAAANHRNSPQGPFGVPQPMLQQHHPPAERSPAVKESCRVPTPPHLLANSRQSGGSSTRYQPSYGASGAAPYSPFPNRTGLNASPIVRDGSGPGPTSSVAASSTSAPAPPPPPTEPKRLTVLALLNSEPEEPKPSKRESTATAPPPPSAASSPLPSAYPYGPAVSASAMPSLRREASFSSTAGVASHYHRTSYGQLPSTTSVSGMSSTKHDGLPGAGAMGPPTSQPEWTPRVLGHPQAPSPGPPMDRERSRIERDVPSYYQQPSHPSPYPHHQQQLQQHSYLGSTAQLPRAPRSPPILQNASHVRTHSAASHSRDVSHDQMRSGPPMAHTPSYPGPQAMQPHPYTMQHGQPSSAFLHQQPPPASHSAPAQPYAAPTSALHTPLPSLDHRAFSREAQLRDEQLRPHQEYRHQRLQRDQRPGDIAYEQGLLHHSQQQRREEEDRRTFAPSHGGVGSSALSHQYHHAPSASSSSMLPPHQLRSISSFSPSYAAPPPRGPSPLDLHTQSYIERGQDLERERERQRRPNHTPYTQPQHHHHYNDRTDPPPHTKSEYESEMLHLQRQARVEPPAPLQHELWRSSAAPRVPLPEEQQLLNAIRSRYDEDAFARRTPLGGGAGAGARGFGPPSSGPSTGQGGT